jgi:hypothetical protein
MDGHIIFRVFQLAFADESGVWFPVQFTGRVSLLQACGVYHEGKPSTGFTLSDSRNVFFSRIILEKDPA